MHIYMYVSDPPLCSCSIPYTLSMAWRRYLSLFQTLMLTKDQLLAPKSSTMGPDIGFVIMQGAAYPTQTYIPLATAIQEQGAAQQYRIWVSIPHSPLVSLLLILEFRTALFEKSLWHIYVCL